MSGMSSWFRLPCPGYRRMPGAVTRSPLPYPVAQIPGRGTRNSEPVIVAQATCLRRCVQLAWCMFIFSCNRMLHLSVYIFICISTYVLYTQENSRYKRNWNWELFAFILKYSYSPSFSSELRDCLNINVLNLPYTMYFLQYMHWYIHVSHIILHFLRHFIPSVGETNRRVFHNAFLI